MERHEPNQDMLSGFIDGVLSHDAMRSMRQHVETCPTCAVALAREQRYLNALDRLSEVEPPADFVEAVMGRVAQQPAHRPAAGIPWRAAMQAGVAATILLVLAVGGGLAWLIGSGAFSGAEPGAMLAGGISGAATVATDLVTGTRDLAGQAMVLLEKTGLVLWRLSVLAASGGWLVQITLLLLTVSLNYAFTRLVMNYQRRH